MVVGGLSAGGVQLDTCEIFDPRSGARRCSGALCMFRCANMMALAPAASFVGGPQLPHTWSQVRVCGVHPQRTQHTHAHTHKHTHARTHKVHRRCADVRNRRGWPAYFVRRQVQRRRCVDVPCVRCSQARVASSTSDACAARSPHFSVRFVIMERK